MVLVLVFKVGMVYTCILLLSAFGKWTPGLDRASGGRDMRGASPRMDLCIMNANELASAALT
jgi:hypothetical protein